MNDQTYTWATAEQSLTVYLSSSVLLAAAHHDRQTGAIHTHQIRMRSGYQAPAPADHSGRTSKDAQGKSRASTWSRNFRQLVKQFGLVAKAFKDGSYRSPLMKQSLVPKADSTKFRVINRPAVLHATVQAVVLEHIEPLIDPKLSRFQHGYRPTTIKGRQLILPDLEKQPRGSTKVVAQRIKRWVGSGYVCVVEADLKDAFDHVDKQHLQQRLVAFGASDKLAALVITLLGDQADYKGQVVTVSGIPQGTILSPLLFNVVTSEIHELMESSSGRVVSYADNFWLCAKNEQELKAMINRFERVVSQLGFAAKFKPTWSTGSGQPLQILMGKGNGGHELHVTAESNKLSVVSSKSSTARTLTQSNRMVGGRKDTVGKPTRSPATCPIGSGRASVSSSGRTGDVGGDVVANSQDVNQQEEGSKSCAMLDTGNGEGFALPVGVETSSRTKHRLVRLKEGFLEEDVRLSGVGHSLPSRSTRYADQDLAGSSNHCDEPHRPDRQPVLGKFPMGGVASPHSSYEPSRPNAGVGEALAECSFPLTMHEVHVFAQSLRSPGRSPKKPAIGHSGDDTVAQTGSEDASTHPKCSLARIGNDVAKRPAGYARLHLVAADNIMSVGHHHLRQVWQEVSGSLIAAGYREVAIELPLFGPLLSIPDVFGYPSQPGCDGDTHWQRATCEFRDDHRVLVTLTRRKDSEEKRLLSKVRCSGVHLTAYTVAKGLQFRAKVFGLINYPDQVVRGYVEIGPTLANPSSALAEGLAHWLAQHPTDLPVTVWLYDGLVRSALRGHYGNAAATPYAGVCVPDMHNALVRWQRSAKACKGGLQARRAKKHGAVSKEIVRLVLAQVGLRLTGSGGFRQTDTLLKSGAHDESVQAFGMSR